MASGIPKSTPQAQPHRSTFSLKIKEKRFALRCAPEQKYLNTINHDYNYTIHELSNYQFFLRML